MDPKVRTRFAPSPTGQLHLGSLRTALFNWLWARKNGGSFILRLEDTDQARLVPQAAEALSKDLKALGLNWDFGPDKPHPQFGSCVQSQRLELYQEIIKELLNRDMAYYDYTPPETLQALRQKAQKQKEAFVFRREMARLKPVFKDQKPAVRVALPDDLTVEWQDVVKGQQSWQSSDIGDFVALKSDGWPTYHLANVVDDHFMKISHVIRADEWLSSTPKHLYLFECLGWKPPLYAHVPPVLMPQGGQKISKREGGGAVSELLDQGYTKEALLNYLALLGWNPKTEQEFFTVAQLVEAFKIDDIQVSGARFDPVRLDWFNGRHIRALSEKERSEAARPWWPASAQKHGSDYRQKVLDLVYERLKKWSELDELSDFFFQKPPTAQPEDLAKKARLPSETAEKLLAETLEVLESIDFSAAELELHLYQLAQKLRVGPSKYFTLLRLKLTGRQVAPGLFETMDVLGLEECRQRLSTGK